MHRRVLTLKNVRGAGEFPDAFIDARRFDDAAVLRQVAVEHGEAAVLRIGVFAVADTALRAVAIQVGVALVL